MRKRAICLISAAALAAGLGGAAFASASAQDGSLVSRSYLEGAFLQGLRQGVEELVEEFFSPIYQEAEDRLDSLAREHLASLGAGGTPIPEGWTGSDQFVAQSGGDGDVLTLYAGSGIFWTSGSAVSSGVLVDVTTGSELASGASLQANHRYLAVGQASVTVTSQAASWSVEGIWRTQGGQGQTFTDVPTGEWYYDAVYWAVANGVTDGTSDTRVGPERGAPRAEIVSYLWRAAGSPEPETIVNPFADVDEDEYYYEAVLWAVENGITDGVSDTEFDPTGECTRGQMVTFLWRAAGRPEPGALSNPFTDLDAGEYYYDAVLWAVTNGITDGMTDTTFAPDSICSRGQAVTFLYRAQ